MNDDVTQPVAGWYADPKMPGTLRFWDGNDWTSHVAPLAPAPSPKGGGTGTLTIARGVALGIAAVVVLILIISNVASSNNDVNCSIDNAERAMDGLPSRVC